MARHPPSRIPVVAVFGSALPQPDSPLYRRACELGRAIAAEGWTLCNGGYGGIMEASAKGAVEAGGHTIGVTCTAFRRRSGPNAFIRQEVPTFDLLSRLNTLVRASDAFVVLPGGTGTLLELALVGEMLNKGLLPKAPPVVLLGDHWVPVMERLSGNERVRFAPRFADSVAETISILKSHPLAPRAD